MDPVNVSAISEVRRFTRSWDNSDCSFGSWLWIHNLGEVEAVGGRDGTILPFERALDRRHAKQNRALHYSALRVKEKINHHFINSPVFFNSQSFK